MSSTFCFAEIDYIVNNLRFNNLLGWILICSESVDHDNKTSYVSRMHDLSQGLFIPAGYVKFEEKFDVDELEYWSKVFFKLGYDIYEGRIGNQSNREWQPTAIADAIQISRLLKELIWKINEGLVKKNKE